MFIYIYIYIYLYLYTHINTYVCMCVYIYIYRDSAYLHCPAIGYPRAVCVNGKGCEFGVTWGGREAEAQKVRGNHLSNTTCLTYALGFLQK